MKDRSTDLLSNQEKGAFTSQIKRGFGEEVDARADSLMKSYETTE